MPSYSAPTDTLLLAASLIQRHLAELLNEALRQRQWVFFVLIATRNDPDDDDTQIRRRMSAQGSENRARNL
eukprot:358308-Chlamydomonas_euryale.AAC.9